MRPLSRTLLVASAIAMSAVPAGAYVRIKTAGGTPVDWSGSTVSYVINISGSDDIGMDASEDAAIRLGFRAWQDVPGSSIAFAENTNPTQRARTDWASSNIHLMLFDETNSSGFFPPGSGIIAVTLLTYNTGNGSILDADLLFDGSEFSFSTDLAPGTFDVQGIATHEQGHIIGLNHSGIGASTMAPFADFQEFSIRSLEADDVAGAENAYPVATKGRITGTVRRSVGMAAVSGAHVWARRIADGRVIVGTLTNGGGVYTLTGLDPGDYRVVAGPLDGPVDSSAICSPCSPAIQIDFQPASTGSVTVVGAGLAMAPDLLVPANAAINVTSPGTPLSIHPGETLGFLLGGSSLTGSTMSIPDSGSAFTISGQVATATTFSFTLMAGAGATPGLYDILLTNGSGQVADHNGFLEVLPAAPTIAAVSPDEGSMGGGSGATVTGTGFFAGAQVLFGDAVGTGTSTVSPTSIDTTLPAHDPGSVDVVVISGGGQEVRLLGGFTYDPILQPGDRYSGMISPAADTDTVFLDGINGTLLSATLYAATGSTLLPKLVVKDSLGTVLLSTDMADPEFDLLYAFPAGSRVSIKKFPLPGAAGGTDPIALEVSGMGGTTGGYLLRPKEKIPKAQTSIKIDPPLAVVPGDVPLVAKRGSLFSAKITASPGLSIEVDEFMDPFGGSILADPGVSASIYVAPGGSSLVVTKAPLDFFGDHVFSVGPTAGAGTITGTLKVRPRKSKITFFE